MNLGRQWEDRLRIWCEQFPKHFFKEYGTLPLEFFTTMEQLPLTDGIQGPFRPAPVGTKWGKKWEYGWFHCVLRVPNMLQQKRLVISLGAGPEMLVWVNGQEAGSIDREHPFITLSRCAKAGDLYEIYAECYAGHGLRLEHIGPVGPEVQTVPEPPEAQVTVKSSSYGEWNEPLFQVAMDYVTLYSLLQKLPDKSLRAMKIAEGLKKFTYIADFELPEPELTHSVLEADQILQPLLACKNGSTAPDYTVFGQSHLDLAWLWPVEETKRKAARTYSNQLALMEEYEDYRFLLCEPPILEWLKELYPQMYVRVQQQVAAGKICPDGATWVESDTNIPSGESLIRQLVLGKRWFRQEMGVESQIAWMPDTFGFSAALPQILKKCQIPYFATQKLLRQDPEADPFPYNLFWWVGMDGSRVLAHIFKKNNSAPLPSELISRWEDDRNQQEQIEGLMYPFGFGDGGGGPTRFMLELAKRCRDLEGVPRCHMEEPMAFFRHLDESKVENTYCGELYLAWHRGTLTSQARTKRGIRKAEVALKMVEYQLSQWLLSGNTVEPAWREKLEQLWKLLLFNQFHDVATGTSIARVHGQAEKELEMVVKESEVLLHKLLGHAEKQSRVYNHLCWPRIYRGQTVPAQSSALVETEQFHFGAVAEQIPGGYVLRNSYLTCAFDEYGQLTSVKISGSDQEFLAGTGNRLLMYKDVNACYDAWEVASMYENLPVELSSKAQIRVFSDCDGATLLVERQIHDSLMSQKIFLGHDARRLDFITEIGWQERHKILKVAFPVNVYATEAIHEIQFGYVKRPTHRSRQFDRDRYEVCNHRYTVLADGGTGAAVLNDCKYGVSVRENEIRLTLLKSALAPDMCADKGQQRFIYSFYPFVGSFIHSQVLQQAYELNEPLIFGSADMPQQEPICLPEEENIVVDTVKPADTMSGAILLRVYEAVGMATDAHFRVSPKIQRAEETDMLEQNGKELRLGKSMEAHFTPFEIKTILLYL